MPMYVFGSDNCLRYKYDVDIKVENKDNSEIKIEKSAENLVGKLGYTVSKVSYSYQLLLIPVHVNGGYCVSLRSIDIDLLPAFNVIIDKRLKEKTCAYDVVFKHEQDHVNVYKDVLKNNVDNVRKSVIDATKNLYPVFVEDLNNISKIESEFAKKIETYKSVEQIKEKIKNKIDEENNKIDTRGDDYKIWRCKDFFEEMKDFYGNVAID